MNNLKLSITLSLVFLSMLGSSQAFAKIVKIKIGKISEGKELIIFGYSDTAVGEEYEEPYLEHRHVCGDNFSPVYMRINGNKIQPACWIPARLDGIGYVLPLGEGIDFNERGIKFRNATLDLDKKKIR